MRKRAHAGYSFLDGGSRVAMPSARSGHEETWLLVRREIYGGPGGIRTPNQGIMSPIFALVA